MINSRNILSWTTALLMATVATWQFYIFATFRDAQGIRDVQGGALHLWVAIGTAIVTCLCAIVGIFRRINKPEELHITS
jgi:hypothetical protein